MSEVVKKLSAPVPIELILSGTVGSAVESARFLELDSTHRWLFFAELARRFAALRDGVVVDPVNERTI